MSSKAPHNTDAQQTTGEVLSGNRLLELVLNPSDRNSASLLYLSGKRTKMATQFEVDGKVYEPISIRVCDLHATRIPSAPLPSCPAAGKLLSSLTAIFCRELALPDTLAERSGLYCMSTWLADALGFQPPAFVTGPDPHEGLCFLRLLHALCRRPVLLPGTGVAAWRSLSPLFESLLIFRPELGPRTFQNQLSCSSYRGIYVPGNDGVTEICRPKAVFVLDDASQDDYFDGECVRICLDGRSSYAGLKDGRIEEIAAKFQPQLLAYRLANWAKVYNAEISAPSFSPAIRNVATAMAACVIGNEQQQQRIISLFADDDEAERSRQSTDPRIAILEVLLAFVHRGEKKVIVQDLTSKVNSLLRDRGEFREYSPMEVGWKLRDLSFVRRHRSGGKTLFLGPDESRRIHEIAKSRGISEFHPPQGTCPSCETEIAGKKSVM